MKDPASPFLVIERLICSDTNRYEVFLNEIHSSSAVQMSVENREEIKVNQCLPGRDSFYLGDSSEDQLETHINVKNGHIPSLKRMLQIYK